MTAELIEGARLILDDRIETASLRIEAGRITGIDVARDGAVIVPGRGRLLAPAFVDIHGDAFERQIMPRPGVTVPLEAALLETDRQLASNGIATAYHALTLSWEPGLRSVDTGWQMVRALETLRPRLTADNRLQLRWETFCAEAEPLIAHVLAGPDRPALAFNDHTSSGVLHPEIAVHDRPFDHVADYPVTDLAADGFLKKMADRAKRAQMSTADFITLLATIWAQRDEVPARIERVAALARTHRAPMLSHDDSQIETRRWYRGLGATVAEFPMHERVFLAARAAGDPIVLGAPNAMRGGSHLGSPGAADMIARGLCDILASDYFYPAMLGAMVRLSADRIAPLAALWKLVSANPAAAMGLADRGRIAPGLRADLVLLDWPEGHAPAPVRTWVAGRGGYSALSMALLPEPAHP
ncbi:MAG: alpha-D-ribose 1-methylphosphonate 5-triphosphate diphosphatase [Tabrizicola sp.]|uniref:alpha-D-ribose 1-methylphosphonate 5-triphosphate diphosphatase n=1 Tax=Tabrizicola sp. TaxID=2005166 RepID=UPI002733D490|nr:alpha-D-ribose 1-methylphosphonate 5-triphosphate diphosphatase [Tabrizicola sp.]MDP3265068.1 alpha-D-ribose 1-methylphosphonate 5-triphosphate diphosphatase [Tabrizicola sp.]MDP3647389.1 alpha-D-ribose 1-methylphosphonate 5-triphosphate diphosphatase [Paracoccaceae bacterium]MDZ4066101.1 alpha-D-ribose 1-methylphosphonate 5-triphosphate diphosphatase [Tabrizicola sp.]